MFSRSALRPLTIAVVRSTATHPAGGGKQSPGHKQYGKDRVVFLPDDWLNGPLGVGLLAYICSGDFCAIRHEHSGLSLGIMQDGHYSYGMTIGIMATFSLIKLLPVIVKWADNKINKIESGSKKDGIVEVLLISPPKKKEEDQSGQ
ncbi:ATP synthase subunit b, mitochondrial [Drosophila eugracilis]|uniref:ATP synthase subunit b, mitochondrial n=1 Tax=Drosophila eugracilis TaxID=29029 RepID=UPI0007E884ED|nr:ATP synthase subunit b, mitochondrial [Drosophila eugracilis]